MNWIKDNASLVAYCAILVWIMAFVQCDAGARHEREAVALERVADVLERIAEQRREGES